MPQLTAEIQNDPNIMMRSGPYMPVEINGRRLMALLDTGAGKSGIDLTIASVFRLTEVGQPTAVTGVTSKGEFPRFAVNVQIPALGIPIPSPLQGLPLAQNNFQFSVIVGRDVLCHYQMMVR